MQYWEGEVSFRTAVEKYSRFNGKIIDGLCKVGDYLMEEMIMPEKTVLYLKGMIAYPFYIMLKEYGGTFSSTQQDRLFEGNANYLKKCSFFPADIVSAAKGCISECEQCLDDDVCIENGIVGNMWSYFFELEDEIYMKISRYLDIIIDGVIGCVRIIGSLSDLDVGRSDYIADSIRDTYDINKK